MVKHVLSVTNQQIIVAKYIQQNGSINHYEAGAIGVCNLPARIYELKGKGGEFTWVDEITKDPHGVEYKRIRRYCLDYLAIAHTKIARLNLLINEVEKIAKSKENA